MQESDVEEDRGEEINEADSAKADEGNEERPRNANSPLLGHNHGRVEAFFLGDANLASSTEDSAEEGNDAPHSLLVRPQGHSDVSNYPKKLEKFDRDYALAAAGAAYEGNDGGLKAALFLQLLLTINSTAETLLFVWKYAQPR